MIKRRYSALVVLALATAAFLLPASSASAGTATVANACANSVTPNNSQIDVTTSGDDGLTTVAPGGTTVTSGLSQSAAIPGAIFVAGYNLGLLQQGVNNIPANVRTTIEATNTAEGQQNTNTVGGTPPNGSVVVSTTITDPDGTPGTGDETATPAAFNVTYDNLTWTAGGSGTIDYRQQSIATAPPTAANNTLLINALVGGFLNVQFRCAPGTVTPPDPGTITLIDPAPSFDTTLIQAPNTAPTANAGADQTVDSGATVQLDGTGSTDPEGDALTFAWTQTSGPPVTLSDPTSATPTFTAPTGPATLTFDLEVCDPAPLCDTDSVTINVNAPAASTISIGDASATEGGAETFTVTLSAPQAAQVTVDFATADGSAMAPGDYTAATGTVTFAPGDVSETVTVQTIDDALVEGTETFDVNLSNVMGNASIADGTGVGTILDNDVANQAPTADAGDDQTVDSGATVQLDGTGSTDPEGQALTYMWTQTGGPAVTLSDPTSATPTFTAPTGPATLTFDLEVCDPEPLCDTDSVTINVNAPAGSTISIDDASATEGGAVTFTVTLSAPQAAQVTVDFATADGSAMAPGDYTAASGMVTFAPGDTSETVTVNTVDDALAEGTETFDVNLSNPMGNATIADGTGVGTINDNDVANQAPTADAGDDQTVDSGAMVQLDGTGSSDPDGDALTYMWTQTSGPPVTLSDPTSATPTFTAPTGPATLTFDLEVCDQEPLCDTDSVTITVRPPVVDEVDAKGELIVIGPVFAALDSKLLTFIVTNKGDEPIMVSHNDIDTTVTVNGAPNGSVTHLIPGTRTIRPGKSALFLMLWKGNVKSGDTVMFTSCVDLAGDSNPANDCDSETRKAVGHGHH